MVVRHRDADRQIVVAGCQEVLNPFEDVVVTTAGRIDCGSNQRNGEGAPGHRPAEALLGDQVGQLMALLDLRTLLIRIGARRPLALMPGQSPALGHQHTPSVEGPVAQLGVLGPPLGERLVAAAQVVVKVAGDPEVAAGHDSEQVGIRRLQVSGAGHVELDPLGRRHLAATHQVIDAAGRRHVVRGDSREVDVVAKP